ncbi:MAG: DNA cytosine methyltransferase [Anaerolineales bacterium]
MKEKNLTEATIDPQPAGTFVDLFCGCGGFTLGMMRAGYKCLAAIDFDPHAVDALRTNLKDVGHVLQRDLTTCSPEEIEQIIGTSTVDVIVGGPPCQGFSTARQRDGSNHGDRLKEDSRRLLYKEFFKFIDHFKPKVFVMENVLGIKSAAGGKYFASVQSDARSIGYCVHGQVEKAWELGVPQKRRRQLIIGTRNDIPQYFMPQLEPAPRAIRGTKLGHAIADLPELTSGSGSDEALYDLDLRDKAISKRCELTKNYLEKVLEIHCAEKLTNHVARPHNERDLHDFNLLNEGENSAVAMREHGVVFKFPYNKNSFKDRYTRQSRYDYCSTIVAHLSKDGLMFVHPTQLRSITPREAARIQSFPDWFRFPKARTHSFRMIGNAVPPLVAESVGLAIKKYLQKERDMNHAIISNSSAATIPKSGQEAVDCLLQTVAMSKTSLKALSTPSFLKAWAAVAYLYPGLHPDGACEKGSLVHVDNDESDLPASLVSPYYEISGWPLVLVPLAEEAWRRHENGELKENELYHCDAQAAGINSRAVKSSVDKEPAYI